MGSRWIRLGLSWSESYWLVDLPPESRLAWVELLCYVKAFGTQGRTKRMRPDRAGGQWGIPLDSVAAMERAAIKDGALTVEGSDWVVTNWHSYQEPSTKRVREHRARGAVKGESADETQRNKWNRGNTDVDVDVDVDVDEKNTHTAVVLKDGNFVADRVDQVLAHTETQATKAESRAELARVVFTYWAARTQANPKRTKWDDKRRTRLVARLKENQDDVAELLCVVDGALNDDFLKGDNDRGRPFLQIQTIFRDREMVEKLATLSPHFGKDIHPFMAP